MSLHRWNCRACAFAPGVAACLLSLGVAAEMPAFYSLGVRPEKDLVAAGLLYFHAPRFAGSEETRTVVVPSATVFLRNGFFADVVNGIGINLSADPSFEYGLRATLGLGREETASLRGLGRIHDALDGGGFANYNVTERWQVQSSARYGSGFRRNGLLVDFGSSYDIFQQGPASITAFVSASRADGNYMRSFYGVSATQSAASGFAPYSPRAGWQWTTAGVSATVPIRENALAFLSMERTRLSEQAAASPYARRRDSLAIEASVAFAF